MTEPSTDEAARPRRSRLALLGLAVGIAAGIVLALAGLGYRLQLWGIPTGFGMLRWAAYIGLAGLAVSLAGAIVALIGHKTRDLALALAGIIIGIAIAYTPYNWREAVRAVPAIHDITTDTADPPVFVAILSLRAGAPNPPGYAGREVAMQQDRAYPDIRPALLDVAPITAFKRALAAARGQGWEIVAVAPNEGRIEASDTTLWFGFVDDVVIRVTPTDVGSRVDIRSKSRVGVSDVGVNAKRIRKFLVGMNSKRRTP
jgi:uncharacterized protein (DUF1499 family)